MPIVLNGVFGGAGIFRRPGVDSVLQSYASSAGESRTGYRQSEDFLLDVHVFVSGDVRQHGRSGVQLGNVGHKTRQGPPGRPSPAWAGRPDAAAP
jgi:hypothetical protein